jgi:hypothetical protein
MLTRGRYQSASAMLLRCILLFLLGISQATTLNNEDNVIGLRRVIYKVHSRDSNINGCRSFGCSSHSNLQIDKSLYNSGFKEVDNDVEENDDKNAIEEGNIIIKC